MRNAVKKIYRGIKSGRKEDGQAMVIAAFALVALIGFAALAIDQSSWLVQQRKFQNAADAAAMYACSSRYKRNSPEDEARQFAFQAASLNDTLANNQEMSVDFNDETKTVVVTIRKKANNYFATPFTGKDKTEIVVTSTASMDVVNTRDGAPYGINSAIEARQNLLWSGGGPCVVNGGIKTGGGLTVTNAVSIGNGDVSADGDINLNLGGGLTIGGNVFGGQNISITAPNSVIKGKVEAGGSFTSNNGGSTYENDIRANGRLQLGADKVNGSILANGEVAINSPGAYIKGDVQSNRRTSINGGAIPVVDGTWYQRGYIEAYQKSGMKNSSGGDAHIEDGESADRLPRVQHGDYVWQWDDLKEFLTYDSDKSKDDLPYTVVDNQMYWDYVNDECDGLAWKAQIGTYDGNYDFWTDSDINGFMDYCREHGKGPEYPLYFPGNVNLNQSQGPLTLHGAIITEKDFTMNTLSTLNDPQDSVGYPNKVAVISLNGRITLGNSGMTNNVNGAVIALGTPQSSWDSAGQIQLNGGGVINGGVIASNSITMNGAWNIDADTKWEEIVAPSVSTTKTFVKLKE